MKKRTKAQKLQDNYDAYRCIKEGRKVKRSIAKDGSIPTHPVVEVEEWPESDVIFQCLQWFKKRHIFCNRHDAGTFQNMRGQWGTYGIKGAGDIIGALPNGIHFEVECKRGSGGRLSIGQQRRMEKCKDNNCLYFVVHGVEELEHYMGDLV